MESGGEDIDLDARGDDQFAVGLDGVVGFLEGEFGMAAAAHAHRRQLGVVAVLGRKEHGQGDRAGRSEERR